MASTVLREPMARKKPAEGGQGRAEDKPGKTTTKVAADLLRKAKMIATFRDQDLYDYLDGVLRAVVERDYEQMIRGEAGG